MSRYCRLALLLLVASLAACSVFRGNPTAPADEIDVHIDNQNFYDATVYLRWQGVRQRLGVVSGHAQETFTTPWRGPQVQAEVELLAGGRRTGDRVTIGPGETVAVEILSQTGRLTTRIR